jgi:hypothetical protein
LRKFGPLEPIAGDSQTEDSCSNRTILLSSATAERRLSSGEIFEPMPI